MMGETAFHGGPDCPYCAPDERCALCLPLRALVLRMSELPLNFTHDAVDQLVGDARKLVAELDRQATAHPHTGH